MSFRFFLGTSLLVLISYSGFSQEQETKIKAVPALPSKGVVAFYVEGIKSVSKKLKIAAKKKIKPISYWKKKNNVGLNMSEVTFSNWNAGGVNSVSALINGTFGRGYKKKHLLWENELVLKYGLNAQEGQKIRKTDDAIAINSTFGYRRDTLSSWYYSGKVNFNTQFANGFSGSNPTPISRFMAPGYLFMGGGAEFSPSSKELKIYISPVTTKSTFVLDQELANKGAFGVQKAVFDSEGNIVSEGKKVYSEFGFLMTNAWKEEVFKNIVLTNRMSLYSDYLNSFGNVDVDWELSLELKVNKYVKTNIGSHIKYDDDVKFNKILDSNGEVVDVGVPKIQFKQLLGVGVLYAF